MKQIIVSLMIVVFLIGCSQAADTPLTREAIQKQIDTLEIQKKNYESGYQQLLGAIEALKGLLNKPVQAVPAGKVEEKKKEK